MRLHMSGVVALAMALVLAAPATAQEQIGDFLFQNNRDPITDADRSIGGTQDEDGEAIIAWACKDDGLNVIVGLTLMMIGDRDDDVLVRYRFDRREPSAPQYWHLSDPEVAWNRDSRVAAFTADAKAAHRLVLRMTDPADGEVRTFEFSMMGLTSVLDRLPCYSPPGSQI